MFSRAQISTLARQPSRSGTSPRLHPPGTPSLGREACAAALGRLRARVADGGRRYSTFLTWLLLLTSANRDGLVAGTIKQLAPRLGLDRHTLGQQLAVLVDAELLAVARRGRRVLVPHPAMRAAFGRRGFTYTAPAGLHAAITVLRAADAVLRDRPAGSMRRARAAAGALEALRHLAARYGDARGQLWAGREQLADPAGVARWLGVDPATWQEWATLAQGAGWLAHDSGGYRLRDTGALEGLDEPGGAFFGAVPPRDGANFGAAPYRGSWLQSPLPPPADTKGRPPAGEPPGEAGDRCAACGAHRDTGATPATRQRSGSGEAVQALLAAVYDRFPAERGRLQLELPASAPLRRRLARLAAAGASPTWVARTLSRQPLTGLRSLTAGLCRRTELALDAWQAEQEQRVRAAQAKAQAALAAEAQAAEEAETAARRARTAAAVAALPKALRATADAAIAARLDPYTRRPICIGAMLRGWAERALAGAGGRPLAELLAEALTAGVDLTDEADVPGKDRPAA